MVTIEEKAKRTGARWLKCKNEDLILDFTQTLKEETGTIYIFKNEILRKKIEVYIYNNVPMVGGVKGY